MRSQFLDEKGLAILGAAGFCLIWAALGTDWSTYAEYISGILMLVFGAKLLTLAIQDRGRDDYE